MGKGSGIRCNMCIFLYIEGLQPQMGRHASGPGVQGGGGSANPKNVKV